ncbi:hypothetical protein AQUCO_08600043v1 [Aquilegia coerulea]|uniref:Cytochrome P450 n=1 Tax=Aquilegia coerulea TaxID=218851 RepID=A0A2G5C6I4_AQUCA|nr:hypothetical protein AQUCO_08600043v1 [Aquilegia coerulea]
MSEKRTIMAGILSVFLAVFAILVISCAWKALNWVWLKPKKIEKFLREQGIKGYSYKFLYGNTKELASLSTEARSKPMDLSHHIAPRIMPFVDQTVQKFGKLSLIWLGPIPRLLVMDPEMIRDILSNKFGHYGKTRTNPLGRFLVTGVISYEGEKWVKHRRIINPAFHLEKLKMMLPAINTCCNEMIDKWQKLISSESCEVNAWPDLQNLTADVISRTAFGSSYEEGRQVFKLQTEQAKHIIQSLQSIYIPGSRFLPTKRNRRMKEIYTEVRTLIRHIVNKRENALKSGEAQSDDLLGLLVESNLKEIKNNENSKNVGIAIDEVIEECKLFYLAGQETTSTLLVWTMVVLSMHQVWQEKAREEVLQVIGKNTPDFDGLSHLKIVTMILYEVLRLYPPVSSLLRATYKNMKLGNVLLPPGVQLSLPTLLVHLDQELWGEDAKEFNPNRFSEGVSNATKNRVAFFPFGWGPTTCIGQNFALLEAKMAIAMILQHFSFELSSSYVHAPSIIVTVQPQHGAHLILHKL